MWTILNTWISYSEISLYNLLYPRITTYCDEKGCNGTSLKSIRPLNYAFFLSNIESTGYIYWVGGDGIYNRSIADNKEYQRPALYLNLLEITT